MNLLSILAGKPDISGKLQNVGKEAGFATEGEKADITIVAGTVIKSVLVIMGSIFLAQIVYAGYKWMTARGDKDEVEKAKDTIQRNVTGFAIMLAAYALTAFVISRLTQATLE